MHGDGWAQRLITQMYFEGDTLIAGLPHPAEHPERGAGARPDRAGGPCATSSSWTAAAYRFDIVLRGRRARRGSRGAATRPNRREPRQWHPHFNETASQTGGPYVHIGLAPQQAGFDIFENNFGNGLVAPEHRGRAHPIEGRVYDGSGRR